MCKTFYIYHVPGVKVGCTTNPERRVVSEQGYKDYEILESHTDISIASVREIELQEKLGYSRDNSQSYENSYNARITAGYIGGKSNKDSGWITELGYTQGKVNVESGHLKKVAKLGGKIAGSKLSSEHMAKMGKVGGNKQVTCPHCNKQGLARPMHRWHFDNCKNKK